MLSLSCTGQLLTSMAMVPAHHVRGEGCSTRPSYREGRRATAVKVYTIHHESRHLIISGVPEVGGTRELLELCGQFGAIESHRQLTDYPTESFIEAFLVSFQRIQSARIAKQKLDDQNFLGGLLHVFYAPEYETLDEVRSKMAERRKVIAFKIHQHKAEHQEESRLLDGIPSAVSSAVTYDPHTGIIGSQLPPSQHSAACTSEFVLQAAGSSGVASAVPQSGQVNPPRTWVSAVDQQQTTSACAPVTEDGNREWVMPQRRDCQAVILGKADGRRNNADLQPSVSLLAQEESFLAYHKNLLLPAPAVEDGRCAIKKVPLLKSNFLCMRSSHATLSSGYDGRLPGQNDSVTIRQGFIQAHDAKAARNKYNHLKNRTPDHLSEKGPALAEQAPRRTDISESEWKQLKCSKKLLSMVPRQAVKGKPRDSSSRLESTRSSFPPQVPKDDALSEKLRKEALVLMMPQGPVSAEGKDAKCSIPTLEEKSVEKTVQLVRKRLSEVVPNGVSKKLRADEQD